MDEETGILEKCYDSCKSCDEGGDSNNHKCRECKEGFIYKNKEETKCIDDCLIEYEFVDIETKIWYNDCNENSNTKKKYNFKNECKTIEEKPDGYEIVGNNFVMCFYFNNECNYDRCPEGTKLDESITSQKNCICNNLYYVNEDQIICVNSSNCPDDYILKDNDSLECSKCTIKYNEQCVLTCPENTYNETREDLIICIDLSQEEDDNRFFKFSNILDQVEGLNVNNNILINDYPNVTINVYIKSKPR